MGVVLAVSLVLAIGNTISGIQPTYWGTFTKSGCDFDVRSGCLPVGTWTSDDGSIERKNIHLDGTVGQGGAVRAAYTPTGFNNDADNNIVHVPMWAGARYWVPWALALFVAGTIVLRARAWRRQASSRT
jgi:hypothetical protein